MFAVGIQGTDIGGSVSGSANVYQYSGTWNQVGAAIDGEAGGDRAGCSVSISGDGTILAVGSYNNDGTGSNAGHVRIYENTGGVWTQIGADIDGEAEGDNSGISISLSDDGNTIVIGAPKNDDNGSNSGHVRIYKNIDNTWTKVGNDIDGKAENDSFGVSVAISGDGNTLIAGAHHNDDVDTWSGQARVFDISASTLSTKTLTSTSFSVFPNPTSDVVNIKLTQGYTLEKINIYNSIGQFVKSETQSLITVNNFRKGLYLFEIITKNGKTLKKVLVN